MATSLSFVDRQNDNQLKFAFGVDLDQIVDPSQAFFLNVERLLVTGDVRARNLDIGVNAGFLKANVLGGKADLAGEIDIRFLDPSDDGRLTLAELVGTPLTDLIKVTPTGALKVTLPIQAELGGEPVFQPDRLPTLLINAPKIFSGELPDVTPRGSTSC